MQRWLKFLLACLLLVVISVFSAYWLLQYAITLLPVQQLEYRINRLTPGSITFDSIRFTLPEPETKVSLQRVTISWQWQFPFTFSLHQLTLEHGAIQLVALPQPSEQASDKSAGFSFKLPNQWRLPEQLPKQINIHQLDLQLPCAEQQCSYQFTANIQQTATGAIDYHLTLADSEQPKQLKGHLQGHYQLLSGLPQLDTTLQITDSIMLQLQQKLEQQEQLWLTGTLALQISPPDSWLNTQLNRWQIPLPESVTKQFSAPVTAKSHWNWQLPDTLDPMTILDQAEGQLALSINLPSPFSLPGIGVLQGQLNAEFAMASGNVQQYQLLADLQLTEPTIPQALKDIGIATDSVALVISADGQQMPQLNALPLTLSLKSQGDTEVRLDGNLTINPTPPFSASLQQSSLAVQQHQLIVPDLLKLETLKLSTKFDAYWLAGDWLLNLQPTQLTVASLQAKEAELALSQIKAEAGLTSIKGNNQPAFLALDTSLKLDITQLQHPLLHPQSWHWQGDIAGNLSAFNVTGQLSNHSGINLKHQLSYKPSQTELSWQSSDIFLLAGNPLADTFKDWPSLLEIQRGRLALNGAAQFNNKNKLTANSQLILADISGIYDRSLFKGLSATLQVGYQPEKLSLNTGELRLNELQHGFVAGPLAINAQYHADPALPSQGQLALQQLELQFMGGHIKAMPALLNLSQPEQELQLQLQQIDLSQLLAQHPSSELTGNGRISGNIPLLISHKGVSVDNGKLAAEQPGGSLHYRPASAAQMAGSNPGMKVLLDSLDNYHYSVLASDVSYNSSGQLMLALTLQGQNPDLEKGRAINFNINLEEDIPALITSLQLSSQISDKIKQRVQQRLQQQRGITTPPGEKP